MGITAYPRRDQVETRSDRFFSKDYMKVNTKRVIFPEYWRNPKHSVTHNQDLFKKQHLEGINSNQFYSSNPNITEKRRIFSFDVAAKSANFPHNHNRQKIRETQSLPQVKRKQIEIDSTLSLPEKNSSTRVSFNPRVSIHLFDLAEVEEAISKKSPVRGWWSHYLAF